MRRQLTKKELDLLSNQTGYFEFRHHAADIFGITEYTVTSTLLNNGIDFYIPRDVNKYIDILYSTCELNIDEEAAEVIRIFKEVLNADKNR